MNKKFSKLTWQSIVAASSCVLLSGCSISIPGFGAGVSSASDVINKYGELMEESVNYHADMNMDIDISADAQGVSMTLPIELDLSADILDGNLHGDMDMRASIMGQEMKQSAEIYVESSRRSSKTYMHESTSDYWTVSEDNEQAEIAFGFSSLDADAFEDATMEYDKEKGIYTVVQEFGDFAGSSSLYDSIEDMYASTTESFSVDPDDILESWEDAEVVYVFDKDFYLLSVSIDGCDYSDTVTESGTDIDISVSLGLDFEFSDYGKIKDSDVEVPDKVAKSALPSDTIIDTEIRDNEPTPSAPAVSEPVPSTPEPETTPYVPANPEPTNPAPTNPAPVVTANDILGSYNGIALTAMGDSWDKIFGADGWEFANDDGEYGFMSAENPKYEDAELYVFNYNRKDTTRSDILDKGIYGYEIDCTWASKYPAMTWNGITFGASANDIIAVYGNPGYTYEGSSFTTYEYDVTDDIEISFYVSPEKGLQRVSVDFFGGI